MRVDFVGVDLVRVDLSFDLLILSMDPFYFLLSPPDMSNMSR